MKKLSLFISLSWLGACGGPKINYEFNEAPEFNEEAFLNPELGIMTPVPGILTAYQIEAEFSRRTGTERLMLNSEESGLQPRSSLRSLFLVEKDLLPQSNSPSMLQGSHLASMIRLGARHCEAMVESNRMDLNSWHGLSSTEVGRSAQEVLIKDAARKNTVFDRLYSRLFPYTTGTSLSKAQVLKEWNRLSGELIADDSNLRSGNLLIGLCSASLVSTSVILIR